MAQVQRLRHEAPDGPLKERAGQIEESLGELSRLSEKLMQLAKAESGSVLIGSPQEVSLVLKHVVSEYQHRAGLTIRLNTPEQTSVYSSIDPDRSEERRVGKD